MNQQALESKKNAVKAIEESFNGSASFIVVSYQGLTVAELSALRKELEKTESTMTVYKNTMVRRALAEVGAPDLGNILEGANAFVFSKEYGAGPQALFKFARAHEALVVKGGIVDGALVDAKGMKEVSKLLDKNGMLSMFLSCLKAPVTTFAATIKAIADKEAPADAPAAN